MKRACCEKPSHAWQGRQSRPAARKGRPCCKVLCCAAKCGRAIPSVNRHRRGGRLVPEYVCGKDSVEQGQPTCQSILGAGIDEAVGQLLVESVTPLALEVALKVQNEIEDQVAQADRLRQQQVQRRAV